MTVMQWIGVGLLLWMYLVGLVSIYTIVSDWYHDRQERGDLINWLAYIGVFRAGRDY